jgi:hypothetical protein
LVGARGVCRHIATVADPRETVADTVQCQVGFAVVRGRGHVERMNRLVRNLSAVKRGECKLVAGLPRQLPRRLNSLLSLTSRGVSVSITATQRGSLSVELPERDARLTRLIESRDRR